MPVTAKLSGSMKPSATTSPICWWSGGRMDQFFSKDSPTSPSAWYKMIDVTYRSELRELNELNYARFEAKLEQRTAGLESRMDAGFERLGPR